ncbi:MAG: hypothetical protein M3R30_09875 [Candidatus Eremiobacteraeota bacterium]|nr:hypothetical protein [Candidatus Eremiobacteraeota bacterium]
MKGWIPRLPLVSGLGSFGLSWIVLFAIARAGLPDASLLPLAWVHLVALGWIGTIALAVIFFALPTFLDVEWEGPWQATARTCTLVFGIAALALSLGFWLGSIPLLQIAGTAILATLLVYTLAMAQPLAIAMRGERARRAIARAFAITFCALLLTAILGVSFAYALGGRLAPAFLVGTPQAHALLGIGGWLTLLVFGVSGRTLGPIAGARSRSLALHIASSSLVLAGTAIAATGAATRLPIVLTIGSALILAGTIAYAADILDVLGRATVPHRPPQAWMGAAAIWAIVAATLLLLSAFGATFASAGIFVALIGWIGSAILAHIHHIGVRVLLTTLRGEDDETRPGDVLCAPVSWATLGLYQFATLVGAYALCANAPLVLEAAAVAGFLAFLTTAINAVYAHRAAAFSTIRL